MSIKWFFVAFGFIVVIVFASHVSYFYTTKKEIHAVVTAPAARVGDQTGKFEVGVDSSYTNLIKIEDSFIPWFHSSGDSLGLVTGMCYKFKLYGFRNKVFSISPRAYGWEKAPGHCN